MNGALPATAMVLSGGGAHGAYEVGVMLALFQGDSPATEKRPLEVNQFAGTSIGSYNAAAMVAGADRGFAASAQRLRDIWLDEIARPQGGCENGIFRVRGGDIANIECLFRPATITNAIRDSGFFLRGIVRSAVRFSQVALPFGPDSLIRAVLEQLDVSSLFDLSPFRDLLLRTAPLDSLRASGLKLKAVASNMSTGQPSIFTEKDIVDRVGHAAIMASSAVPGFFPPVDVGGDVCIDGGALMNTPVVPASEGSDTLHVVYLDPAVTSISIQSLQSTLGVIDRMLTMFFSFSMNEDIAILGDYNRSLGLAASLGAGALSDPQIGAISRAALAVAQQAETTRAFIPTTIHRYHPTDDLGGALGFLDVSYDTVKQLIDRGYQDTVGHDCVKSGCVLPGPGTEPVPGGRR
jgi:predicted acylesterase/phospholipase RssA